MVLAAAGWLLGVFRDAHGCLKLCCRSAAGTQGQPAPIAWPAWLLDHQPTAAAGPSRMLWSYCLLQTHAA